MSDTAVLLLSLGGAIVFYEALKAGTVAGWRALRRWRRRKKGIFYHP